MLHRVRSMSCANVIVVLTDGFLCEAVGTESGTEGCFTVRSACCLSSVLGSCVTGELVGGNGCCHQLVRLSRGHWQDSGTMQQHGASKSAWWDSERPGTCGKLRRFLCDDMVAAAQGPAHSEEGMPSVKEGGKFAGLWQLG